MRFACATGFVTRSPLTDPAAGPLELVDERGRPIFTLRDPENLLGRLVKKRMGVRVCGRLRGTVCGSAPNLDVTSVGPATFTESPGPDGSQDILSPVIVRSCEPLVPFGAQPTQTEDC